MSEPEIINTIHNDGVISLRVSQISSMVFGTTRRFFYNGEEILEDDRQVTLSILPGFEIRTTSWVEVHMSSGKSYRFMGKAVKAFAEIADITWPLPLPG